MIKKYSKQSQLSSSLHVLLMTLHRLSFSLTRLTHSTIKFAWLCWAYKAIYISYMELCSVISAITVCNMNGIDFGCKYGLKICNFAR